MFFFFFQAEDGIRDDLVTGVQTCALPIWRNERRQQIDDVVRGPVRGLEVLACHRVLDLVLEELDGRLVAQKPVRHSRLPEDAPSAERHWCLSRISATVVPVVFPSFAGIIGTSGSRCKS